MNILYTNFHPGHGGGHTTYLTYIFDGMLLYKDLNIYIAIPKTSKLHKDLKRKFPKKVFDIDFPGKPKEIINIVKNVKILAKKVKENNIEVVHVNGTPDHKVVMLCKWFYRFNFKIIRTKHDITPIKKKWFARKIYGKYTDHLIVVSQKQYDDIENQEILKKTSVIKNGVDIDKFAPRSKSKKIINKFYIEKDDIVFVSTAGTNLGKGWQYLVNAVSLLGESDRGRIKILIAGNKPPEKVLARYVLDINMQSNVVFTGMLSDVRELVSVADVGFVLSKEIETISFACREMMAMGKPMIVSDSGGLPENIDESMNGWVTAAGDVNSIYEAINKIFKADLDQMSIEANLKAKNEFSLYDFISKTKGIYSNL